MKKLLLLFVIGIIHLSVSAQSWQELYDSTEECWHTDQKKCREILKRALVAAREEFGEMDSNFTLTLHELATVENALGDHEKALKLFQKCTSIQLQVQGPDNAEYGSSLYGMAHTLQKMGVYSQAKTLAKASLEIVKKNGGEANSEYGQRLVLLGFIYQEIGEFAQALPMFLGAVDHAEKMVGKSHPYYGNALNHLGNLYKDMGDMKKATALFKESLEVIRNSHGETHFAYGICLNNLANAYGRQEMYEQALPLYQESVKNGEKSVGKKHVLYGIRLGNLATIYSRLGDYDKALNLQKEATEIIKEALGDSHRLFGQEITVLSKFWMEKKQYEKALPLQELAGKIIKKKLGESHVDYGEILESQGTIYLALEEVEKAYVAYESLHENTLFQIQDRFSGVSTSIQNSMLSNLTRQFNEVQSFSLVHPEYTTLLEKGFEQQLWMKGLMQGNTSRLLESLRADPDTNLQKDYDEWERLHQQLAVQYQQPIGQRLASFDSLANRAEELEIQLLNQSEKFREARKKVSWKEIQATLQPTEAIVEFSHFHYYESGYETDSIVYVAYVLRPGFEHPKRVFLFPETALKYSEEKNSLDLSKLSSQLYTSRGIKPRKKNADTELNLHTLIWKPLAQLLDGVDRINYSPSGLLHRINLAAISIDTKTYFGDQFELIQLGSSRALIANSQKAYTTKDALLMGGINYGENEGKTDAWSFLQGTENEVRSIAQKLNSQGFTTSLFTDDLANENQLGIWENSPRILHIATHGYFFPTPDINRNQSKSKTNAISNSDHPMVRSGLILANANQAWTGESIAEGGSDGILTAYEISRMDLSNTELVVLSACETGLGDIEGNEGVYGLQRAFKIAGAKYILMSLWQVPDQATQELMTAFYEKWLSGMEIRKAFRSAQKQMRKKYKEPYYWAGFVLVE